VDVSKNHDGLDPGGKPYPTARAAWTMVAILMVANIFSFVDRQIVSLLIDPIKNDLHIDDIQVSLLIGPAFAVFFSAMALPIGRMVDVMNRMRLAAAGIAFWSAMTVLSGFSETFQLLFVARIGVAIGEAVMFPAANSLIADSFAPAKRARPIGAYATAIYLGSGLAFLFGGAIIGLVGHGGIPSLPLVSSRSTWQLVLLIVGAPGFFVAFAILALREPERHDLALSESRTTLPIGDVLKYVRRRLKPFFYHAASFSMFVVASYALSSWVPTHLTRTLGMSRSEAGVWYGLAVMIAGIAGIMLTTSLADRMNARGVLDGKFRICGVISLLGAILVIASAWISNPYLFIVAMGGVTMVIAAGVGLGPAALQEIAPNELRGQSLAAYLLIATVLGAGLGPTLVAVLTQSVFANPDSLGSSMAIVAGSALLLGALGFFMGREPFRREVVTRSEAFSSKAPQI
jgi:MFS family permease